MDTHLVQLLFLDLAVVLVVARAFGYLATRVRQPPVVGEIVAGILIGAAVQSGPLADRVLPTDVRGMLSALATVGLAWFMFAVGLEVDPRRLGSRARSVASVAAWSLLAAFGLGAAAAPLLMQRHPAENPLAFTVTMGLVMSVTAFPVLARILADRGLLRSLVGDLAMATSAITDVVAWIVLAVILAWAGGTHGWQTALLVPYLAVMLLIVRPLLRPLVKRDQDGSARMYAVLFGLALLSAAATEAMGVHFIFGAFLAGVVVRSEAGPAQSETLRERADKATSMLLPVYFVMAGIGLDFLGLRASDLLEGALLLIVAVVGKAAGSYVGGRVYGLDRWQASLLASLLNTRGLTEIIILGVAFEAGILDQSLYSLMVAVAVITTVMTGPLINLLEKARPPENRSGRAVAEEAVSAGPAAGVTDGADNVR